MSAKWTSNLPAILRRNEVAQQRGALAAAQVAARAVKARLRGGYTSGDFVTGASENAVTIGAPIKVGGVWQVRVGTPLPSNLDWEFGHINLFTRKYERVEKWRPAGMDARAEIAQAFGREYKRTMESR